MNYTMIVLLEFYPSWLALSREQRREHANTLYGIIEKYHGKVNVRFFDAEALPGRDYTDFVICETTDLQLYHYMWEEIRDSKVYTNGYMRIKDVIMGMENAFREYESDVLGMDEEKRL